VSRILDRSCNSCDPTSASDHMEPVLLLWRGATFRGLDFNAGEHRNLLANHVGRDGDGAQADQISGTTSQAELNGAASAWIWKGAGVVAEQAQVGACA